MGITGYYLGCPIWSYKGWVGNLFSERLPAGDLPPWPGEAPPPE